MSQRTKTKRQRYDEVKKRLASLLNGESDAIAAMATVSCELHHEFDAFSWTGFYRRVTEDTLKVGPYQGGHGCLTIPFARGVCGKAARTGHTQLVDDVTKVQDHIACSSLTKSEIVVPIKDPNNRLVAVLDIDSEELGAFDSVDQAELEAIAVMLRDLNWAEANGRP